MVPVLPGGASPTYNIPWVARLTGKLNANALRDALQDVVERHETLRTLYPPDLGVASQRILHAAEVNLNLKFTRTSAEELPALLSEASRYSFELSSEPGIRAELFSLDADEHVLLLLVHHIAGWLVLVTAHPGFV